MNCCPSSEQLRQLLNEDLQPAERTALEMHVETCLTCQEILARLTERTEIRFKFLGDPVSEVTPVSDAVFLCALGEKHTLLRTWSSANKPGGDSAAIKFPGSPTAKGPLGRLGSYQIAGLLGSGRFGFVYLAHDALDRLVAIKILKPELAASARERARFAAEARAAAAIKQDHVVDIYQVGESSDFPLPYIVMEYLDGESLSDRLRREGALEAREATRIVQEVAFGLAAAHDRSLVHRDIKPSNIILERASGRAKVMDFGLACATEGTEEHAPPSEGIVGTPAYMSPEQVTAPQRIGARTDVYSLGVVLYELLTGERPFRGAPHMILEQVVHEPPRPLRRLNDRIPRDLETICLKALAKEPGRRYQTARELADDLRRWRNGEPIRARAQGPATRLWKWCRRKPALATLTVALILAVLGGFGGVTWQWQRAVASSQDASNAQGQAEQDRHRAEANLLTAARAVDKYLSAVTDNPRLKDHDLRDLRRQLLESALPFFQQLVEQQPADPLLARERGGAYMRLASIEREIGALDAALAHYQRAQAIFEEITRAHPEYAPIQAPLAGSYNNIGRVFQTKGEPEKAERAFQLALAVQTVLVQIHPDDPEYQASLAITYNNLGLLYASSLGRIEQAEQFYREALTIRQVLVDKHGSNSKYRFSLSASHTNLGNLHLANGQLKDAERAYLAALVLLNALAQDRPIDAEYQAHLAGSHYNLGRLYADSNRNEEAEEALRAALTIQRILVSQHATVPEYQMYLARTYNLLGELFRNTARFQRAEEAFQEARNIQGFLVKAHPGHPNYQTHLAGSHYNLGALYMSTGRFKEADQAYEEALTLRKEVAEKHPAVPPFALDLGVTLASRGDLALRSGQPTAAAVWCAKAVAALEPVFRKLKGRNHASESLRNAYITRAQALMELQHYAEALKDWDRALELYDEETPVEVRLKHALTLARVKEHARATAEANTAIEEISISPQLLYLAARVFALAASPGTGSDEDESADRHATRAIDLLRQAIAKGYNDVDRLRKDSDLDALRSRDDFQKLHPALEEQQRDP